jgi:hypothetical protein
MSEMVDRTGILFHHYSRWCAYRENVTNVWFADWRKDKIYPLAWYKSWLLTTMYTLCMSLLKTNVVTSDRKVHGKLERGRGLVVRTTSFLAESQHCFDHARHYSHARPVCTLLLGKHVRNFEATWSRTHCQHLPLWWQRQVDFRYFRPTVFILRSIVFVTVSEFWRSQCFWIHRESKFGNFCKKGSFRTDLLIPWKYVARDILSLLSRAHARTMHYTVASSDRVYVVLMRIIKQTNISYIHIAQYKTNLGINWRECPWFGINLLPKAKGPSITQTVLSRY